MTCVLATVENCLRRGGEYTAPGLIRVLLDCAQACRRAMEPCRQMGGPDRHDHA